MFIICPLQRMPTFHFLSPKLLHFPTLYLAFGLPEGQAGTLWDTSEQYFCFYLAMIKCSASYYTPHLLLPYSSSVLFRFSFLTRVMVQAVICWFLTAEAQD
jgi:hypothetical protein